MPALTRFGATRRAARRRGFTLIETMIALVLVGIVATAIVDMLMKQSRFYSGAADLVELRGNMRQPGDLFPTELRSISPALGDILFMSDSALEFRAPTGSSVVCRVPGGSSVAIPPAGLSTNSSVSAWANPPVVGDSVFIYDWHGTDATMADDSMRAFEITAINPGGCPNNVYFKTAADSAASLQLSLSPSLTATIVAGMPVRFYHRVRYNIYKSPTDGLYYVGYKDCLPSRATPCSGVQPVSGPFASYAPGGNGGFAFTYYDASGAVTAVPANVRRIDVVVRAQGRSKARTYGLIGWKSNSGVMKDSVRFSIALRN